MTREDMITTITRGFEDNEVSLRQFSLATNMTYQVLLRESRKPIPGVPYNPDSVNYESIVDSIIRKYGTDVELPDFSTLKTNPRKPGSTKTPSEWNVGDKLEFRNFSGTYEIMMITVDHVVFMEVGTTKPRVMNKDTFEHQGPRVPQNNNEKEGE